MQHLILKDWYLSRQNLTLLAVAAAAMFATLQFRTEVSGFVGLTGAFIVIILLGINMPMQTIVNERKRQNLPFVMSLPVSPMEYTTAKIIANLVAFVLVWLPLTGAVLAMFKLSGAFAGLIPILLIAALAPFVAFCLILATAIVFESETASVVVMAACNVSYSFSWFFLVRIPNIRADLSGPVAVWSRPMLAILSAEISLIVLAIGLTFFFQSRKTDFI
jgi:ABC-type transport system involved in multi-copper enzyme maturation permease subunit